MTNSHENETSKCLSGIIRRLLCTGSLPTHPSDHLITTEPNTTTTNPQKDSKPEVISKPQAPPTPGIVARLMGLDSFPDFNWASPNQRTTLDSLILRSRSVNSFNYLPEVDLTQSHHHRRVRTSVSFREENSEIFVLCLEKVSRSSLSGGITEMGLEERKQRRVETERNRGDVGERKFEKKKKVSERKGEPNGVCGKFGSNVDNVSLPQRSISDMGLEEVKQRKVEKERNRGNFEERKFEKKVSERKEAKNYREYGECSSKIYNKNLPRKNIPEMGLEGVKQREVEAERNRENLGERKFVKKKVSERKVDNGNLPRKSKGVHGQSHETLKGKSAAKTLKHEETSIESKFRNKKNCRSAKEVESFPLSKSEKSSPVSVLDLDNIFWQQETTSSGESRVAIPNPRRKPSSTAPRNFRADDYLLSVKRNREEKPIKKTRETQIHFYSGLVSEIFRLTEEGIEESNWVPEKAIRFEDVEEICTEFGQQILDLLFQEVADELVGFEKITEQNQS